jgi:hypothetical protein
MNSGDLGKMPMVEIAGFMANRYQLLPNCAEVLMGPQPVDERSDHDLFRTELVNLIDHRHELVKLGDLIDWQPSLTSGARSSLPPRGAPRCPHG